MRRVAALFHTALLLLTAAAHAQDPRANANPCQAFADDQRFRRQMPPLLYNGVDKLVAPMETPIKLPPEFVGDWRAVCVFVEFTVREQGGGLVIEREHPRGTYPPRRSDMTAPVLQAGVEVLRQIPLAKVLPRRPTPGATHIIAVPLWPGHSFYNTDPTQVIGHDLREIGYVDAHRVAERDGVSVYRVFDRNNQLVFVAMRTLGETDPIAEFADAEPQPGSFERLKYKGAVADIFRELIEPSVRDRRNPVLQVEVRHYARGVRYRSDPRNTEVNLQLANDPASNRPVDHPLFISTHVGTRAANSPEPYAWSDRRVGRRQYANLGELNRLIAELKVPPEEKARRAQEAHAKAEQARTAREREIDAQQQAVRQQIDPNNPLASLGYPNATPLVRQGRTNYFLSEIAADRRVVVAVHEIGENDRIFTMVPGPQGGFRYTEPHIGFVQQHLVPAALARWPGLTRVAIHHHVRGLALADTPDFRRLMRSRGYTYEKPLFEEEYGRQDASNAWRPFYEIGTWSRERAIFPQRHEFHLSFAEARAMGAAKVESQRLANASPEQRREELTAKRLQLQQTRSPHTVHKSDRFWMSLPGFDIPERVFNGDFAAFEINRVFPQHYRWFLEVYSKRCTDEVKKAQKVWKVTHTWTPVETDRFGNVRWRGKPEVTELFFDDRFYGKYKEYESILVFSVIKDFFDMFMSDKVNPSLSDLVGPSWRVVKDVLNLTYSWRQFFNEAECTSASLFQMRENMLRAALGRPSLQAEGVRIPNAVSESQPLVPAPEDRTIFDSCYLDHEYKERSFCACMDRQAEQVMRPEERRRYSADFSLFYKDNVFAEKSGPGDPRWRLYKLVQACRG